MIEWTGYKKGVNLGGWLSQCCHKKEHYDTYIKEEDIALIASWGADHVRLSIDYGLIQDENGHFLIEGFRYIDKCINWCDKYGLNLILVLHQAKSFSFDEQYCKLGCFDQEKLLERYYVLWIELAKLYGKYSQKVSFELMNEITDENYAILWNGIAEKAVNYIRCFAPDTYIIIGGICNNSVDALKMLDMPYDDKIIYNFHFYHPIALTHQKAPCHQIKAAVKISINRNVPIYCGEYGAIDQVEASKALPWYQDINAVFEKYNIGRAIWTLKGMNFGIIDESRKEIFHELIKLL